jgi:hypothetical protein
MTVDNAQNVSHCTIYKAIHHAVIFNPYYFIPLSSKYYAFREVRPQHTWSINSVT